MFWTVALIIMPITDLPLEAKYCSACIGAPRAPIYSGAEVVGREARQRDAATAGGVARHSLEGGVIPRLERGSSYTYWFCRRREPGDRFNSHI